MNKQTFLSQVIMTFLMAATMSGLLGLIFSGGPSLEWLASWPRQFAIAWPLAFLLTMVAWPTSTALTNAILRPRAGSAAAPATESPRADDAV
ncbi:DUF2798 domain-containing protein [Promicromonospora thailandica]|uniref:DUF2798 domain-containing protein n=1 Tax=Promicromonospora thailandica TaxID=765201 RepID=A0A9X2JT42_9MICO|nr:DUF2798 domain-containing protein [Promicromonospora thailandica]MCP2263130.1 Protein of unknown function (DUF2798) [Promicromonospora thailandica]BFF18511.1 DUF2798 domain-containing protein [Promicromonospora thailandica]